MRNLIIGILFLGICIGINLSLPPKARDLATTPLPRPEFARLVSGEFTSLSSDYFLVQAAIFYGSRKNLQDNESEWLGQALSLSRYLDPYYKEPYWMAASVLPWQGEVDHALQILGKGKEYRPDDWKIPFNLGFINFYFRDKPKVAASYFQQASSFQEAPEYVSLLASRLYAKKDQQGTAITFLRKKLQDTQDEMLRKKFKKRLKALNRMRGMEKLLRKYKQLYGNYPDSLQELKQKGLVEELPEDPYGGEFYITKEHRVQTSSELR